MVRITASMSPLEKRERSTGWYQQWIEPVTQALYLREAAAAGERLAAGYAALDSGTVRPPDVAEKTCLLLDYSSYFVAKLAGSAAGLAQCPVVDEALSAPASDSGADALRRRLLLQFRCSAERLGHRPLTIPEFEALVAAVPEEERNDEFWHFSSTWAFAHGLSGVLEQAYGEYSVNRGPFMADWLWWRVRLMHLLSTGEATAEDVRQLLHTVDLTEHLADFQRTFIPVLERSGMLTAEVAALVRQREELIASRSREDILRTVAE
jgi:hypothetical protein